MISSLKKHTCSTKSMDLLTSGTGGGRMHFLFSTNSDKNCFIVSNLSPSTTLVVPGFLVAAFFLSPDPLLFSSELGLLGVLVALGP